jgi:hypothetical protein
MESLNLTAVETSDSIRLTGPFVQLRLNGDSYLSSAAARMLGFNHGDVIRFYHNDDRTRWFVANDPICGATIKKASGLYKFCDIKVVRKIFASFNVTAKRANFPIYKDVVKQGELILIELIPKPQNVQK